MLDSVGWTKIVRREYGREGWVRFTSWSGRDPCGLLNVCKGFAIAQVGLGSFFSDSIVFGRSASEACPVCYLYRRETGSQRPWGSRQPSPWQCCSPWALSSCSRSGRCQSSSEQRPTIRKSDPLSTWRKARSRVSYTNKSLAYVASSPPSTVVPAFFCARLVILSLQLPFSDWNVDQL